MSFFSNIKNSIYNPQYYGDVMLKPFSYSLKYFFGLILFLTLLSTLVYSFTFIPTVKTVIDNIDVGIAKSYPDNLEITITGGKASSNVQEPYFIKLPADWEAEKGSDFESILTIDTKNTFSLEQFDIYNTTCILNKDSFTCHDQQGTIKIMSLSSVSDFKLNKPVVSAFSARVHPFLKFIYPIFVVIIFVGTFFLFLLQFAYLLVAAVLIWLVAKIKKVTLSYGKAYQLGLHLLTVPLVVGFLISAISSIFGIEINSFFLFPTALLLIVTFLNLKRPENTVTVLPNKNSPI